MFHAAKFRSARSAFAAFALLLTLQPWLLGAQGQIAGSPALSEPRCPEGSTTPKLFAAWFRRATELNAELFVAEHGRAPEEGELRPLLPEQIELNLKILCNCRPHRRTEREQPPPAVGSCVPDAGTLCLDGRWPGDGRFEVRVMFHAVPAGAPCGAGQIRPLAGRFRREGLFWCSGPEHPELMIKLVDGCAANGHYWVVWSAARGVEVSVTITDKRAEYELVHVVRGPAPETDLAAFPCEPAGPISER